MGTTDDHYTHRDEIVALETNLVALAHRFLCLATKVYRVRPTISAVASSTIVDCSKVADDALGTNGDSFCVDVGLHYGEVVL